MREQILKQLETAGDLPPFPKILAKLQAVLDDPEASISEITKIINLDPALSGKILSLSNSVFYSSAGEVKTLEMAVNKLGLVRIKHIAYSLKLTKLFENNRVLDYFLFWRHRFIEHKP